MLHWFTCPLSDRKWNFSIINPFISRPSNDRNHSIIHKIRLHHDKIHLKHFSALPMSIYCCIFHILALWCNCPSLLNAILILFNFYYGPFKAGLNVECSWFLFLKPDRGPQLGTAENILLLNNLTRPLYSRIWKMITFVHI